jgi:hypothetical protein
MSASPVNDEFSGYREQTVEAVGCSMFLQVDRVDFFASKPAPTFDRISPDGMQSPVGAGLLAKASA